MLDRATIMQTITDDGQRYSRSLGVLFCCLPAKSKDIKLKFWQTLVSRKGGVMNAGERVGGLEKAKKKESERGDGK